MTRLAIAIVVIMIACLFLWVSSSYPTPEEIQKGEELKSLGDCLGELSTPCPKGYLNENK